MAIESKKFKFKEVEFSIPAKSDWVSIKIGKKTARIKTIDFWGIAFAISNSEHKDKIIPVRKTEMMKFKRVHTVQLKNDMKAGETLQFTSIIDVPTWIAEGKLNPVEDEEISTGVDKK